MNWRQLEIDEAIETGDKRWSPKWHNGKEFDPDKARDTRYRTEEHKIIRDVLPENSDRQYWRRIVESREEITDRRLDPEL